MNQLTHLALQNFRSYPAKYFEFKKTVTLIVGKNAVGKTSIVEAISLLATTDSFRAGKIDEMISFDQEYGRVKAKVLIDKEPEELEILLTRGSVQGKRTLKRLYSVNGVRKRKKSFLNKFYVVVFRPEDMRLIEGSPGRRRSFLDTPLAAINPSYTHSLVTYDKALRQYNKLLEQVREGSAPVSTLSYWNMTMLKHGELIQEQRQSFLATFSEVEFPLNFSVEYQPSIISEDRIKEYQSRAIAAGHSLIGPHKDDFIVRLLPPDFDIAKYGSRGQQRMAVLWLKVAEQNFLEQKTVQKPILLLDDILSELDSEVKQKVLDLLPGQQVLITSADLSAEDFLAGTNLDIDTIHLAS